MSGRVTGIGGIYFKCDDPEGLLSWYENALGLTADDGSIRFGWLELDGSTNGRSFIMPLPETSIRFEAGTQPFIVSYRVDDLDAIVQRLREAGDSVIDSLPAGDGRSAYFVDPDGQKIQLWEPGGDAVPASVEGAPVTGIGGIFFKSGDRAALKSWYQAKLGIEPDGAGYVVFSWRKADGGTAYLSWEVFASDTDYFDPSTRPFMINLRVTDLDGLRGRLLDDDAVWVDPKVEKYEYGKFGWIVDPAGIRIELWEPNDGAFD